MSAVIERRNAHGVLLRYRTDVRGPHHDNLKLHPTDRLRCAVLQAKREIRDIRVMLECLDDVLSEAAIERFEWALRTIDAALDLVKPGSAVSPFALLNAEQQRGAVLRLADSRLSDNTIASMTGLDAQTVRRWLAERARTPP